GPGEKELAQHYRTASRAPCVDLIGQTDLPGLAAILAHVRLLVTNDTGTLHLAAGLDVPSLSIFLATAQPFDTGPYREGCLCLEPDMPCHPCPFGAPCPIGHACREAVPAQTVTDAALGFFACGAFAPGAYPGARAWLSRFDASGFMDMTSLSGHGSEPRAVWLRLTRLVLRQFLDEEDLAVDDGECFPLPAAVYDPLREMLGQSAELLRLLAGQAGLAGRNAAMKDRFLGTWERLRGLWTASPHLGVLGRLWMEEAQRQAADLESLLGRIARYAALVAALSGRLERI
ncbi:MAG TPA: glycosyltransferase family 9 protein, partial [Desulfovibrio sp.]|nr:glycosyltransferase family 9 protein [Desulfovibrio sp.]